MPRSHFTVVGRNPNPRGACLCSPAKLVGCAPPYIVFTHAEMMDARQQHAVLSVECACAAVRKAQKRSDVPGGPVAPAAEPSKCLVPSIDDVIEHLRKGLAEVLPAGE